VDRLVVQLALSLPLDLGKFDAAHGVSRIEELEKEGMR
jgi:hypothetical protein